MNTIVEEFSMPTQRQPEEVPATEEKSLIEKFRTSDNISTPDEWYAFIHDIAPTNTIKDMFGLKIVQLCAPEDEAESCVRILIRECNEFKPYDTNMIITHYVRHLARERVAICADANVSDPLVLRLALKKGERFLTVPTPLEGTVVQERFDTRLKTYR
jgi:hypothetical protein